MEKNFQVTKILTKKKTYLWADSCGLWRCMGKFQVSRFEVKSSS